jgi:hypothetical protein
MAPANGPNEELGTYSMETSVNPFPRFPFNRPGCVFNDKEEPAGSARDMVRYPWSTTSGSLPLQTSRSPRGAIPPSHWLACGEEPDFSRGWVIGVHLVW